MDTERKFDLIVTIVNRGFADEVMNAARAAGAHGGTILWARGSGVHETEKFFGISIQPEKELVLILVIIIALLVIFKEQLIDLLNTIFEKITSESSGI